MNGAESLIRTALAAGVDVCFANPGTTEMPLVAALDAAPGFRAVLGLFEGVCTGAADGYARMTGRPALTLLHLGPGFANGIANLHNAHRAQTPLVNLIGDHMTWHAGVGAPLASDIESLARPVSSWVRRVESAAGAASDLATAIQVARTPPGRVATLIVPHDHQEDDAPAPAAAREPSAPRAVEVSAVTRAAAALSDGAGTALFLGGNALGESGLCAAGRIAEKSGCALFHATFVARLERGPELPHVESLPYFPEQALERLAPFRRVILVGAREPVSFFGYHKLPSRLVPEGTEVMELAAPDMDAAAALGALAEELGAVRDPTPDTAAPPDRPRGALTPDSLGQAIAALQPEGAIVMNEGITNAIAYHLHARHALRHTTLGLTGGAIGQGLPCAVGAAIACPERKVIAYQADGAGMYTLQALWTAAREGLDLVAVICANRSYRILQVELARSGGEKLGVSAAALTRLDQPELDWVALAKGMGVCGARVESAEAFTDAFLRALAEPGPRLIEAVI